MTLEWRPLEPGAVDHELLWTSVLGVCAALAVGMLLIMGVPPIGCVFKAVTGLPCLTCGFTRGALALLDGDILASIRWNPLVPLGVLGAIIYMAYGVLAVASGPHRLRAALSHREAQAVRWAAVCSMAAVWVWLIVDGR